MMTKLLAALLVPAAFALVLGACDADKLGKLRPGVTTADEVRNIMGRPDLEWRDPDGSRVWEYPRTPEGIVNYMVVIGPNNVLREVQQVLTEDNFRQVVPGMSRDEVRRLLGRPAHQRFFPMKGETVWDWKTKTEPGMDWFFNVHFNQDGLVSRTSTNFEPRG